MTEMNVQRDSSSYFDDEVCQAGRKEFLARGYRFYILLKVPTSKKIGYITIPLAYLESPDKQKRPSPFLYPLIVFFSKIPTDKNETTSSSRAAAHPLIFSRSAAAPPYTSTSYGPEVCTITCYIADSVLYIAYVRLRNVRRGSVLCAAVLDRIGYCVLNFADSLGGTL